MAASIADYRKTPSGAARAADDGPGACTWFPGTTEASPHEDQRRPYEMPKICDTILDHIGNTPLVRLNKIPAMHGVPEGVEILAKCEFFNAGGSVKDRIGKRMVSDAEASGRIKPGDTLIEPTSGNTGIGLALNAAVKGYKMVITLPEKMSNEKVDVLKALGAEIHRTPNEAAYDAPESHIGVAARICSELGDSAHILDQYKNPSNPLAHYDGTAEELLYQTDGKIDFAVIGAGTGGTLTGTARKLRERCPGIKIVAVDPVGSILAEPDAMNDAHRLEGYAVEGIGYDFIPTVLDRSLADFWVKANDRDSFLMCRKLIRHEGLLCGGSCGTAVWAACEVAKAHAKPGDRIVVILPDSTRNYMTKFLNDQWMRERGHIDGEIIKASSVDTWWSKKTVSELGLKAPVTVTPDVSVGDAIAILAAEGFDALPVVDGEGQLRGVITDGALSAKLTSGRCTAEDPVTAVMFSGFHRISAATPLGELSDAFDAHHFAVCVQETKSFAAGGASITKTHVTGVVTRIDLLAFIKEGPQ